MQAYIAISYTKRKSLRSELNAICEALKEFSIRSFVFVDNYSFGASEEKHMMKLAFEEIDKADLLIAEVSEKAIGIGIEAGYAKGKNKPIIYLRKINAEHSTTVGGTADHTIIYKDPADLKQKLSLLLLKKFKVPGPSI